MRALICGSMAYDTIMVFQDRFKNHILPDQVHILNVSFLVPQMRREFGGCAGNIAYNLKLLGGDPLPMATVGEDFAPYRDWLDKHGIDRRHVTEVPGSYTGQAFITTDLDDNQITAFHPGAMGSSHLNKVGDAKDVALGIVSPDGRDGMIQNALNAQTVFTGRQLWTATFSPWPGGPSRFSAATSRSSSTIWQVSLLRWPSFSSTLITR